MYTESWCGTLKERDHLEDVSVGGMILKWIFKEEDVTSTVALSTVNRTNGGLF